MPEAPFNKPGMRTYHDQDKDREAWNAAMKYRKALALNLKRRGVATTGSMTLKEMETLLARTSRNGLMKLLELQKAHGRE